MPSFGPTDHVPYSCRGCPGTPSAAAAATIVSCENVPAASKPHALPEPPSVDSPLAVNTVRPPYQGYISLAESARAAAAIDAASGAAGRAPTVAAQPASEIGGAAVTVSGSVELLSPYA